MTACFVLLICNSNLSHSVIFNHYQGQLLHSVLWYKAVKKSFLGPQFCSIYYSRSYGVYYNHFTNFHKFGKLNFKNNYLGVFFIFNGISFSQFWLFLQLQSPWLHSQMDERDSSVKAKPFQVLHNVSSPI